MTVKHQVRTVKPDTSSGFVSVMSICEKAPASIRPTRITTVIEEVDVKFMKLGTSLVPPSRNLERKLPNFPMDGSARFVPSRLSALAIHRVLYANCEKG